MTKLMFCRMSELNQLTGKVRDKHTKSGQKAYSHNRHKEEEVLLLQ